MKIFKRLNRFGLAAIVLVAVAMVILIIQLESLVKNYVNEQINALPGYSGGIESIDIDLWRGAYVIRELRLQKEGGLDKDFLNIDAIDLSIRWRALLYGKIAAEVGLEEPRVIFAKTQSGKGADWLTLLNSVTPFDIVRFQVKNGTITYLDYDADPKINLFINKLNARINNISNVTKSDHALPTNIFISGHTIGDGVLKIEGGMNILRDIPDFDLSLKIENADIPYFNNYFQKYALLDFKKGTLNVYSEIAAADGQVTGYVKPIATGLDVVDLEQDKNPLEIIWESIAAFFLEAFQNQSKDQFALKIPIEGKVSSPEQNGITGFLSIFTNAFVAAFDKNVDETVNLKKARQESEKSDSNKDASKD